jgi:hypothetical protein
MPSVAELVRLLTEPNESLTLEYKGWLDLVNNRGKATLAKAAIALANEGGGIIVMGMRAAEDGPLLSQALPAGMARYDQDAVNSAINRFADPEIHCELAFAQHPGTNIEHAFVIVPGGSLVPVMSTRDVQGEITAQRCYVRKPGPRSEEPYTAEEWRGVFERCLRARRESMLDAIRLIVQGHVPAPAVENRALSEFRDSAKRRWETLIAPLPSDDVARMPLGNYELSFEIVGVSPAPSFTELRNRLDEARRIKHTGWGPFVSLSRADLAPNIVDDTVEAWLGEPDALRRLSRTPDHCDFWRANRQGFLFLQRGYDEDNPETAQPGTVIDFTLPIWRVGEALLFVSRLSRTFVGNPSVSVRVRYSGLRGRELTTLNRHIFLSPGRRCADDEVRLEAQATAVQLEDNIVEVVHSLLCPLYERFDFFELPLEAVARQLEEMRRNRF